MLTEKLISTETPEPETRLTNLRKLNDEVQVLERHFFGSPQNIHDEQTLRGNLADEAYNNYISETRKYIQVLEQQIKEQQFIREQQIKEQMEEVQTLESYLGIKGAQHDREWWSDEQQVNSYLHSLREKKDFFDLGYQKAIREINAKKEKQEIKKEHPAGADKVENPVQPSSIITQFNNTKREDRSPVSSNDKNPSYFSKILKYGLLGGLTCLGGYLTYKCFSRSR